ncbi:helicase-related protein [Parvularcula maris]|uniref:Helicase-related protein n=1 Tax=Parvularcula maris TaxID=2965077 RepID=A0A9X2RJ17_9PROT|nr:helicase-related protein [Parvularcula maris]MCQ8184382.1 helicase-related protein [Parvularcula maris]
MSSRMRPQTGLGPSGVTAVLGPTNTGKTFYALERMAAHPTGMIGLPLRLLAREVYEKMVDRRGERAVAMITGEEKIVPPNPSYWVCTVEAMPLERRVSFLAIDEVQLAADADRGRIFTDRILHARGQHETLLLGSDTMGPILSRLVPGIEYLGRERFSQLTHTGHKKVTRLPRRTAIVAFSADAVYSIAELIRRQRGGAAVVMGALSPRTRNAQAALYNDGEVDYLVATDAIGMGLNMDIDHVAFAQGRKFDGRNARNLQPAEVGQIAGRAGRHVRDGTWGSTAECPPFDEELIHQVTEHTFQPVTALQWRNPNVRFGSLPALLKSLEQAPTEEGLVRARTDDDEDALRRLARRHDIREMARGGAALKLLWEVCQVPDFRKVTPDQHAIILGELYEQLIERGSIRREWAELQLSRLDNPNGDIDAISNRIAHVRTWTYLSHRSGWLDDAGYFQGEARRIEDKLSDILHERLTQRFVDRRTSVLLKRLKDDAPLLAGVRNNGEVVVEGEFVGRLLGFQFILDPKARGPHEKRVRFAALKALGPELMARASALAEAKPDELKLADSGEITWRGSPIAKLRRGPQPLRPDFELVAMEHMPASAVGAVQDRLRQFIADRVEGLAGPLVALQRALNRPSDDPEGLSANARGVAFRLVENFGAMSRRPIADEVKALTQDERAGLRKLGVRFGEYTLHLPALLKPAPAKFLGLLWSLSSEAAPGRYALPPAGATSVEADETVPHAFWYAVGYRPSGKRAVRIDMLERLAQEIRKARDEGGRQGFETNQRMMSLVGVSGEAFEDILKNLGYKKQTVEREVKVAAPVVADPVAETVEDPAATAARQLPADEPVAEGQAPDAATQVGTAPPTAEAEQAVSEPASEEKEAEAPTSDPAAETSQAEPTETHQAASQDVPVTETPPAEAPLAEGETVTETVTLWRYQPPRGPRRDQKDGRRGGKPGQRGEKRDGPRSQGPKGKGGKRPPKDQKPRTFSSGPRKRKEADPDSPFAVLANLKKD